MKEIEVKKAIENFLNNPNADTTKFLEAVDQINQSTANRLIAANTQGSEHTANEMEIIVSNLNLNFESAQYQNVLSKIDMLLKTCQDNTYDDSEEVRNINATRFQVLAYLHFVIDEQHKKHLESAAPPPPSHRCTLI